jgi:hypothetical protein
MTQTFIYLQFTVYVMCTGTQECLVVQLKYFFNIYLYLFISPRCRIVHVVPAMVQIKLL